MTGLHSVLRNAARMFVRTLMACAFVLAAAAPTAAENALSVEAAQRMPHASVLFVRDGAIWYRSLGPVSSPHGSSSRAERKVAQLGPLADELSGMRALPDASGALLELGARIALVRVAPVRQSSAQSPTAQLADPAQTQEPLPLLACTTPIWLSESSNALACNHESGVIAVHDLATGAMQLTDIPSGQALAFADRDRLIVGEEHMLWAQPISPAGKRERLTQHRPKSPLSVAPNGKHAAATYPGLHPSARTTGIFVFQLDGMGVRRRLMARATPVKWSGNSRWLLAQSNREGACVIRAAGGQYKCWRRFQALDLAHNGSVAWLVKASGTPGFVDVYRGIVPGVQAEKPMKVAESLPDQLILLRPCPHGCAAHVPGAANAGGRL